MTKSKADDIRRHFDVVAEHLQSQNQQLAEGIAGTHERIDGLDTRMERVEVRIDRIELRVTALDSKVGVLDCKVNALDTKVDRVEHRLDDLTVEVRQGFAGLGSLIKTTYGQLDGRLTRVEAEGAETRSEVEKLKAKLAS